MAAERCVTFHNVSNSTVTSIANAIKAARPGWAAGGVIEVARTSVSGLCVGGESDDDAGMAPNNTGANFQIIVDGKTRSYRDMRDTALEAGKFLKERHPQSEVVVRDVQNNVQTIIGWKNGSANPISSVASN